jgi:hypothetical protein
VSAVDRAIWVDGAAEFDGDGSRESPYLTIGEAVSDPAFGTSELTIFIKGGHEYVEAVDVVRVTNGRLVGYGDAPVTINGGGATSGLRCGESDGAVFYNLTVVNPDGERGVTIYKCSGAAVLNVTVRDVGPNGSSEDPTRGFDVMESPDVVLAGLLVENVRPHPGQEVVGITLYQSDRSKLGPAVVRRLAPIEGSSGGLRGLYVDTSSQVVVSDFVVENLGGPNTLASNGIRGIYVAHANGGTITNIRLTDLHAGLVDPSTCADNGTESAAFLLGNGSTNLVLDRVTVNDLAGADSSGTGCSGRIIGIDVEGTGPHSLSHVAVSNVVAGDTDRTPNESQGIDVDQTSHLDFITVHGVRGTPASGIDVGSGAGVVSVRHAIVSNVSGECVDTDADPVQYVYFDACDGNLPGAPMFVAPANGDLHLMESSPAIDVGSDNPDDYVWERSPNGCQANLGAYGNTPESTSKAGAGNCP